MSDDDIDQKEYSKLRSIYKYYIDSYNALYQLKTEKEEELNEIYKMIKTELLDSKKHLARNVIKDILNFIPYNNRYTKSYLYLTKLISDDYHVKDINDVPTISNFLFYKEYGIKLDESGDFDDIDTENLDIHTENTIYRAIMYNDLEKFIAFTASEEFDNDQRLESDFYPDSKKGYSLLELCCYHGAVDCFKFLRTKFNSEITKKCLQFSFLGGNPEIMSECLKSQEPGKKCMKYAIISHNIDFVTFLMNEYDMKIDLYDCGNYNNLEAFFVKFDQNFDQDSLSSINSYFIKSAIFAIPSLCEYFISQGANINEENYEGKTALFYASEKNSKEMAELLLSHGANVNAKKMGKWTALHYALENNSKETAELLISHGAKINAKTESGVSPLYFAVRDNYKEMVEFLLSHGAKANETEFYGDTLFHYATGQNYKEIVKVILSHGQNINERNEYGKTALHIAAENNYKEITELLLSHGAKVNITDYNGCTPLHIAAIENSKETAEFLISHDANVNAKDDDGCTSLYYAEENENKETAEVLISHGAKI
ncbi:hypothetical protein TVAG_498530 [Trichomonas vaginalis G3]|uniref:DUF3447 domain-containing protein n=1 Tax=Trichomonas vaginalis (strain ATCC PRA-98 / G3) TaxID=412133 RepID=A2E841_TRIV3|nr:ankyrin repeat and SOCS box-containing protein 4 family [Trichomonas vaginalis G3]EAY11159.1 hypothetical protein TVAG_498530 [Trichomonas vaginalis G3]KAI5500100.1 ankyrin repeat and SOCS box-containing protein 4 family [Trichomonas vaginalis G3]|eukprot:XP_001323382.1 hypothetical protein [Trichomonas vaginalis G3]